MSEHDTEDADLRAYTRSLFGRLDDDTESTDPATAPELHSDIARAFARALFNKPS